MIVRRQVCVDAGLVVKLVIPEPDSDRARLLFAGWVNEGVQLIAPVFFLVETDSILRKKIKVRGELTQEQARLAFANLQTLPIQALSLPDQRRRAWEIAREFDLSTVYDATYLALAELIECEFWTADERLFNQTKQRLTYIRWLGDYAPIS